MITFPTVGEARLHFQFCSVNGQFREATDRHDAASWASRDSKPVAQRLCPGNPTLVHSRCSALRSNQPEVGSVVYCLIDGVLPIRKRWSEGTFSHASGVSQCQCNRTSKVSIVHYTVHAFTIFNPSCIRAGPLLGKPPASVTRLIGRMRSCDCVLVSNLLPASKLVSLSTS